MKKLISLTALAALVGTQAYAGVSLVANGNGLFEISDPIDSDVTLNAANEYLLTEIVYVSDATITIPAGTVVRGVVGVKDGQNNVLQ